MPRAKLGREMPGLRRPLCSTHGRALTINVCPSTIWFASDLVHAAPVTCSICPERCCPPVVESARHFGRGRRRLLLGSDYLSDVLRDSHMPSVGRPPEVLLLLLGDSQSDNRAPLNLRQTRLLLGWGRAVWVYYTSSTAGLLVGFCMPKLRGRRPSVLQRGVKMALSTTREMDFKARAILCDSVVTAEGKLYIQGGGWNLLTPAQYPFQVPRIGLALTIDCPVHANQSAHRLTIELKTEDARTLYRVLWDPWEKRSTPPRSVAMAPSLLAAHPASCGRSTGPAICRQFRWD